MNDQLPEGRPLPMKELMLLESEDITHLKKGGTITLGVIDGRKIMLGWGGGQGYAEAVG